MASAFTYIVVCFCILLWTKQANSQCQAPQKAIYLSFKSMANRDHMVQLFQTISRQTATYNISYRDSISLNNYEITSLRYRLGYNNHYQIDSFVDQAKIKINLGIINIFFEMKYNITDSNKKPLFNGIGFARSQVDPTSFQKFLTQKQSFIEWAAQNIEDLTFTSIITIQNIISLPEKQKLMLQKILNNVVATENIRPKISAEIDRLFKQKLTEYLNKDHLFSTADIPYQFKNISIAFDHKIKTIRVSKASKGVVAFIDFGVINSSQVNCGILPSGFNETDYGGLQQFITMKTIKFILMEAINKGLFNLALDKNWQTEVFQFVMGDLANAIPYANIYNSNSSIKINCGIVEADKTTFSHFDDTHMYLEFREQCTIKDDTQDIIRVNLHLMYFVKFQAESDFLSVKVDRIEPRLIEFKLLNPKFVVQRNAVALMITNSIVKTMIGGQTFGTKIPLLYRRYPALILSSEYLIVFDYSELQPGNILQLENKLIF